MSIALPSVSLASVSVGQTGIVDLKNTGIDANPSRLGTPAHLMIYNESGVGLIISFLVGNASFHLPAGGWLPVVLQPGESQVKWQVEYVLNVVGGAPVSQLLVTYYAPNEPMPPVPQLGNSPIGGSVGTSSIQTLSNEGNPANTLVIDIGDAALAQLWQIFTDHFSISVDQSGVSHTVLQGKTSGNPLLIGKSGDTSEVLGNLAVDGNFTLTGTEADTGLLTATGGILLPNNIPVQSKDTGGTVRNLLLEDGSNNTIVKAGGSNAVFIQDDAGNTLVTVDGNGIHISGGGQKIDAGGGAVDLNIGVASGQTLRLQNPLGTDVETLAAALITFLVQISPNKAATTVSGSVAGSCTFTAPIWGSALKVLIVQINGWNSATAGTFIFPTGTFGFGAFICGNDGAMTWGLNIGATAQTIHAIKTLGNNTTAGTDDALTAIRSNTVGWVDLSPGADRIVIGTTGGAVITSTIVLIGF